MSSRDNRNAAFVSQVQRRLKDLGLYRGNVDGDAGPQTIGAWNRYLGIGLQLDEFGDLQRVDHLPLDTEEELTEFYGPRGSADHQVVVSLPYPMRLAWNLGQVVTRTTINRRCAESFLKSLEEMKDELGLDFIHASGMDRFGGVFNNRTMKGNPDRWSTHAWACAVDLDPYGNRYGWRWPGEATMPIEVVQIFVRNGWQSAALELGKDGMHMQAARFSRG